VSLAKTIFLDRNGQWSEDANQAVIRIDSELISQSKANNSIYCKTERGWQILEDTSSLTGDQRGLFFNISPAIRSGKQLVAFEGVRFLDQELLTYLDKLDIYDESGQLTKDSQSLATRFLLTPDHAKQFAQRIKNQGGKINKQKWSELTIAEKNIDTITNLLQQYHSLSLSDVNFLEQVLSNEHHGKNDFEHRGLEQDQIKQQIISQLNSSKTRLNEVVRQSTSTDEQGQLLLLQEKLELLEKELNTLQAARNRAEEIIARELNKKAKQSVTMPLAAKKLLLHDFAQLLKDNKQQYSVDEQGIIVDFPGLSLLINEQGIKINDPNDPN
jgi:hypothetical protein